MRVLRNLLIVAACLVLPACGAVETVKTSAEAVAAAETTEQKLFAVEGSFIAAQAIALPYIATLPDGKVKEKIKKAEAFANAAIDSAHVARRQLKEAGGNASTFEVSVAAAAAATDFLTHLLSEQGLTDGS